MRDSLLNIGTGTTGVLLLDAVPHVNTNLVLQLAVAAFTAFSQYMIWKNRKDERGK